MDKLSTLLFLAFISFPTQALDPKQEIRYCGEPRRTSTGQIYRDSSVVYSFRKVWKCPSTKQTTGACPGWSVDHIVPLVSGGCDAVWNMQWLPNEIKSSKGTLPKDRWEREVYK